MSRVVERLLASQEVPRSMNINISLSDPLMGKFKEYVVHINST
jgi:hypothetical protein